MWTLGYTPYSGRAHWQIIARFKLGSSRSVGYLSVSVLICFPLGVGKHKYYWLVGAVNSFTCGKEYKEWQTSETPIHSLRHGIFVLWEQASRTPHEAPIAINIAKLQPLKEHKGLNIAIAALQEMRLPDEGSLHKANYTFYWKSKIASEVREYGVGIAIRRTRYVQ